MKNNPEIIILCIILFLLVVFILLDNKKAVAVQATPQTTKVHTIEYVPTTVKPEPKYYNVPLSQEMQDYIFTTCKQYNVNPKLVIAIITVESECIPDKVNGNCKGLMQINSKYHSGDLTNPYTNIWTGIQILSYLNMECNGNTDRVILAYNRGLSGLKRLDAKGIISTPYLKKVLMAMEGLNC